MQKMFLKKYYCSNPKWYWVADQIGGILYVNDNFYSMENIVNCLKLNVTAKDLFAWYTNSVDEAMKGGSINLVNWLKLKKGERLWAEEI
ncbi:hypothetical protein HY745_02840 [Candidatus Desantisbacteria bacterium]|nr:hypothetical protein [Candidatus Desantisbacteria bacterium]